MKIIVGLGNIGKEYDKTYHNIGFMAVNHFLEKYNLNLDKTKFKANILDTTLFNNKVLFALPTTFMNKSGESVIQILNFYKAKPEDVLVVFDDVDIKVGSVRFRNEGSSGTHNGIRNITQVLNSEKFKRLKIGTKDENSKLSLFDFVVSKISKENLETYDKIFDVTDDIIEEFIKNDSVENKSINL